MKRIVGWWSIAMLCLVMADTVRAQGSFMEIPDLGIWDGYTETPSPVFAWIRPELWNGGADRYTLRVEKKVGSTWTVFKTANINDRPVTFTGDTVPVSYTFTGPGSDFRKASIVSG